MQGEEKGRDQEGKIHGAGEVRTNLMEQYDTRDKLNLDIFT